MKKSLIILLAAIVAAGALAGISAGLVSPSAQVGERVIVIDAGHGGVDSGVLGVNTSVKESEINLYIAREVRNYFSQAGFKTVMTRNSSAGLYGSASKGFKMRDMKKRRQIIIDSRADMVISVHQNRYPIASRRGGQVFFNPESEDGKRLAELIQKCLNEAYMGVKPSTALKGDYYMLKCTDSPSVIVECGFLSNPEDESLLLSEEFRKKVAYAIFKGAVSYYS